MNTPRNSKEVDDFFAFEAKMQIELDKVYVSLGYEPTRNPNKQYDLHLMIDDRSHKVEEKIWQINFYDDFLIEIVQDLVSGNKGWFSTTGCDLISYVVCKNSIIQLIYFVQWQRFKDWFVSTYLPAHKKGDYIYSEKGYGATVNIPVLWGNIPGDMYTRIVVDANYETTCTQANQPQLMFLNMAQEAEWKGVL